MAVDPALPLALFYLWTFRDAPLDGRPLTDKFVHGDFAIDTELFIFDNIPSGLAARAAALRPDGHASIVERRPSLGLVVPEVLRDVVGVFRGQTSHEIRIGGHADAARRQVPIHKIAFIVQKRLELVVQDGLDVGDHLGLRALRRRRRRVRRRLDGLLLSLIHI